MTSIDLENKMSEELIPDYVRGIMKLIVSSGHKAFVAGGAVRDIVRGKRPHDYDVATSARPEETVEIFKNAGVAFFDNAAKHGTVTAVTSEGNVEVTTFREDGSYSDLRRPDEVIFRTSIEEDVRRRDFTINAMYMDAEGVISDPVGGIKDCRDHLIRAVGVPSERFAEDALRILRGLRFCSRLGFDIEPETLLAMEDLADELRSISEERIASELLGIVTGKYASKAIRLGWKILSVIIPEIADCRGKDQRSRFHDRDILEHILSVLDNIPYIEDKGKDSELAMAALFHDLGKPACFKIDDDGIGHMKGHPQVSFQIAEKKLGELKYPKQFVNNVCLLVLLHDTFIGKDRIKVHKFMSSYPLNLIDKLQILQRADIMAHSPVGQKRIEHLDELIKLGDELKKSGAVFSIKDLAIDGKDIIALGVSEGPAVGMIMKELFDHYLEEKCENTRDSLTEEARIIIGSKQV